MDGNSPVNLAIAAARSAPVAAQRPAPELSVIVPTFNERDNVPILVERLSRGLSACDWEVIFVDDNSPDGTAAAVRAIAETDSHVRCIRRIGRRGLAGACIEGMLASQARYVAVMDADLQHDDALLAVMLARLRSGDVDLVVASRYCDGGAQSGLSAGRAHASRWSVALARRLLKVELTDPMSGFFMMRRDAFGEMAPSLSTQGFKILLDIAATARGRLRIVELPYRFGKRLHGESKLDSRVALDFFQLVLGKLTGDAVSLRFVLFCLVGSTGVAIHMGVLTMLYGLGDARFSIEQTIATTIAIAWNFVLNNAFTYRDQRLSGWRFAGGLVRFELICAVGAVSNVGIANSIYGEHGAWWLAGLCGALVGAVWNYAVSSALVWRAN